MVSLEQGTVGSQEQTGGVGFTAQGEGGCQGPDSSADRS